MSRCSVCASPQRAAIELDRQNGDTLDVLAERYGVTHRSVQWHFSQGHYTPPKPDESPAELGDRLARLVTQAEGLLTDSEKASFGERTKAVTALNGVLRLALQCAGQLKALAPAATVSQNITDSREYRELIAKVNEAVVCPACREALKRVLGCP